MDGLRIERHMVIWHNGGLESDGVIRWGVGCDGHVGGAEVHGHVEEEEEDAARHRQEKREAMRLGNLLSHTEA